MSERSSLKQVFRIQWQVCSGSCRWVLADVLTLIGAKLSPENGGGRRLEWRFCDVLRHGLRPERRTVMDRIHPC